MGVSLTRTPGTPTSKKKFTFSFWYKKTTVRDYGASTSDGCFFNSAASNDNRLTFMINQENSPYDQVRLVGRNSGSQILDLRTNAILRDPSAWYHIVAKVDTTQSTNTNRAKLYINGTEQTLDTSSYPNQDVELEIHHTPYLLSYSGSGNYVEGLITHYHYTDGYAYDASTFGETDSTSGIWKPKTAPSVTYGTNGFFLKFENSGAMGTDSSGNSNTFTVNGSLTQNVDTPSNNFITMNPLDNYYPGFTFSNGNTTLASGNNYSYPQATIYVNKGKWYWEVKAVSKSSGADEFMIGIQGKSATGTNSPAQANNGITYYKDGDTYGFGGGATSYGNSYTVGDIIGVALDCDNNKLYFSKNGTYQNSGVPTSGSTGTGALAITDPNDVPQGGYSPVGGAYTSVSHTLSFNFGSGFFGTTAVASANADSAGLGAFEYSVPSGYYSLCTKNIKDYG